MKEKGTIFLPVQVCRPTFLITFTVILCNRFEGHGNGLFYGEADFSFRRLVRVVSKTVTAPRPLGTEGCFLNVLRSGPAALLALPPYSCLQPKSGLTNLYFFCKMLPEKQYCVARGDSLNNESLLTHSLVKPGYNFEKF
jgi:hypothetical protein